jgi:predicted permease
MRWPARVQMFLRSLFGRGKMEAGLAEELREHLEAEIASNLRTGMTPEEAGFAARRSIGSVSLFQDECRDARGTAFIENCWRDLRYAFQLLRRTPLFTAAAVLTLALGIGANTAIFTFVENIVMRSLPIRDPQQVVSLNWGEGSNMSYPNYLEFRDQNTVFSSLVATRLNQVNLSLQPRNNFLSWGYEATGNYFETLGVQPLIGRFFGPSEDDKAGAHPVMVISYKYWQTRFAGDVGVLGKIVKANGHPFSIIGVAPSSFAGTELIVSADFWVPMSMEREIEGGYDWLHQRYASNAWIMGRLKNGVTHAQATANLDQIAHRLAQTYPNQIDAKARFHLSRPGLVGTALRRPITSFAIVLIGIATAGLLLACANLAGMLLGRASDRQREIGIRLAIGAGKWQVFRQLMLESLLLACTGGLCGFALAMTACRIFSAWQPAFDLPLNTTLQPNWIVSCFSLLVTLSTTVLFGLVPALQAVQTAVLPSLKNEPSSNRLRKWSVRDLLVVGQIALSVVLVICSALVARSLQQALRLNLGFNPNNAASVSFDLRTNDYSTENSRRFDATLLERASALPGMEAVGIINNPPLRMSHENSGTISRADRPVPKPADRRGAVIYKISPGYLKAAGTRLLSGRDVNVYDRDGVERVAVVNEALTHLLFGKDDPLGRYVRLSNDDADRGLKIVGVVETGKYEYLGEDPHPAVFLPIAQTETAWTTLVARSSLPSAAATELLRKTVLDLNPELTLSNTGSLKDQMALPLFPARAAATVLGIFGALAMLLAATGLFALMA